MPKFLYRLFLISTVLLSVSLAHAQDGPSGRWWHNSKIAQQLNLTPSEIQRLESAFNDSRIKMIELKSRVETEQVKLQRLLESRKLDERAIKNQNRKLEQARTSLSNERTQFVVQVRKIIGSQRFQKLLDMRGR